MDKLIASYPNLVQLLKIYTRVLLHMRIMIARGRDPTGYPAGRRIIRTVMNIIDS